jgi:predicted dehydrogenase
MGKTYYLEADYNYGRIHKIHNGWRGTGNYSVVLGGGIHMVDLSLWLMGERVTEVSARGNRICSEGTTFSGNDLVLASLQFEGGAIGKVAANFGCVYPHFHRIGLYATQGSFINDWPGAYYVEERGESPPTIPSDTAYPGAQKGDLLYEFVESILGKSSFPIDPGILFHGVAICLAIDRSAELGGQAVKVQPYLF